MKRAWPNFKHYLGICLENLREITKTVSYDNQCPGRDSNFAPPKYKSEESPLEPTCLVLFWGGGKLQAFENRALRKIFGSKKDENQALLRHLHNPKAYLQV
jgi:hypothetical protein